MEVWRLKMEPVAAGSHLDEEQDPDPHYSEQLDPHPHCSEKLDPNLH
jgi:hypothetical protein